MKKSIENKKYKRNIKNFLKPDINLILSDINNYIKRVNFNYVTPNKLKCAYCKKNIEKLSLHDHLYIWNKDETSFVCFHTKCAFRDDINIDLNVLLNKFDFIYDITNEMKKSNKIDL